MKKIKIFSKLWKNGKLTCVSRISDLLSNGFNADTLKQEFVRVNLEVWDDITENQYIWTPEIMQSQFVICPDLLFCGFIDGKMVACSVCIRTTEEELSQRKTWLETTNFGYLNTHKPSGSVLFGVDLSATQESSQKLADKLVLATIFQVVIGEGLKALCLVARIPAFHKHTPYMSVEDYVYGKRKSGKPLDPELYFYMKNGFEIVDIIPGYMEDHESLNYGVLIRWKNPFYWVTKVMPFLKPLIRFVGRKLFLRLPELK